MGLMVSRHVSEVGLISCSSVVELASLYLSFLICTMGMIRDPTVEIMVMTCGYLQGVSSLRFNTGTFSINSGCENV